MKETFLLSTVGDKVFHDSEEKFVDSSPGTSSIPERTIFALHFFGKASIYKKGAKQQSAVPERSKKHIDLWEGECIFQ